MGVTRVNAATLPKASLEFNLPGAAPSKPSTGNQAYPQPVVPVSFEWINLPIPNSSSSSDYNAWVAAR